MPRTFFPCFCLENSYTFQVKTERQWPLLTCGPRWSFESSAQFLEPRVFTASAEARWPETHRGDPSKPAQEQDRVRGKGSATTANTAEATGWRWKKSVRRAEQREEKSGRTSKADEAAQQACTPPPSIRKPAPKRLWWAVVPGQSWNQVQER